MEIIKHTGGKCGRVLVKEYAIYKKWINEGMTALKLDMENVCYPAGAQKLYSLIRAIKLRIVYLSV